MLRPWTAYYKNGAYRFSFNEEVDSILDIFKVVQNQHYKLATLRGDDPVKEVLNKDLSQRVFQFRKNQIL